MDVLGVVVFVGLIVGSIAVGYALGRQRDLNPVPEPTAAPAQGEPQDDKSTELYEVANELSGVFDAAAKPADLLVVIGCSLIGRLGCLIQFAGQCIALCSGGSFDCMKLAISGFDLAL